MRPTATLQDGRQRILDAATAALRRDGVDGFRVEQVLLEAGASSSSLYHHFGSRNGLIRAATTSIHRDLVLTEDRALLDQGMAAATHEEFCTYVEEQLRRAATCTVNRARRIQRVALAAASLEANDHQPAVAEFQILMTSIIADIFEFAKTKAIINPDLDSFAYCAWFQGMLLGRLLIEATLDDTERWLSVAMPAALAPLRMP